MGVEAYVAVALEEGDEKSKACRRGGSKTDDGAKYARYPGANTRRVV